MASKVFFHNAQSSARQNRLAKIRDLFQRAGFERLIKSGDRVAIKMHWGEPGNTAYLPPPIARTLVECVKEAGGLAFLTDTNTLYTGLRRDAVQNVVAASMNGFSLTTIGAPIIVADGLKGLDYREVELPGPMVQSAKIASAIMDADSMIVLTHVKGHMVFGYGGCLKNLGMGCTTPAGKQVLHSDLRPRVDTKACKGDGICIRRCPVGCIELVASEAPGRRHKVAYIDTQRCIGCGECTAACPHGAIPIRWQTAPDAIQRKTAEYALAAVKTKVDRVGYLNCIVQVTPDCDCCDWNDPPFVPDVGFAASLDPVALDVASADLVRDTPPSPGGKAAGHRGDPWRAVYDVDYRVLFSHAEQIGLGSQQYELVRLS